LYLFNYRDSNLKLFDIYVMYLKNRKVENFAKVFVIRLIEYVIVKELEIMDPNYR